MSEDLISKEKAYKVLTDYYHHKTEMQHKALREALDMVPSADIDLSDYSDRLWRNAYEQGKADAEPRWIPVTERLPEIDMSHPHHEDYLVQYDSGGIDVASWSNVNRFWTDHVTEPYWNCVQFAKVVAYMPLPEPWEGDGDAKR